jgi:hypothetical protein
MTCADPRFNSQWIVAGQINPFQPEGVEFSNGGLRSAAMQGRHVANVAVGRQDESAFWKLRPA